MASDKSGGASEAQGYPSTWLRGFLPAAVLAVVARGETYGYAIAQALEAAGLGHVKGGALYPVLATLEKDGLIEASWAAGDGGPGRKMLAITPDGLTRLLEHREQWAAFTGAVGGVLGPAAPARHDAAARP
ncbi:PadR family transcriptional regulator [Actinomyces haliotis]|uniref:PadR family transcriptional regulator n=1 Tax=Actinomyces haliotis TaxID=1280843 RepID=UPI00188EF2E0|nr:PadR family transcriptional regulator [Actinomyces haliotis]